MTGTHHDTFSGSQHRISNQGQSVSSMCHVRWHDINCSSLIYVGCFSACVTALARSGNTSNCTTYARHLFLCPPAPCHGSLVALMAEWRVLHIPGTYWARHLIHMPARDNEADIGKLWVGHWDWHGWGFAAGLGAIAGRAHGVHFCKHYSVDHTDWDGRPMDRTQVDEWMALRTAATNVA